MAEMADVARVRLVFEAGDLATGGALATDLAASLHALRSSVADVNEDCLVQAAVNGDLDWAHIEAFRKVLELDAHRFEVQGTEPGSLVVFAAVRGIRFLWEQFEVNKRLRDALFATLGSTELIADVQKTSINFLDRYWRGLKEAFAKHLSRAGFTPTKVAAESDHALTVEMSPREPLAARSTCCCEPRN